MKKVYDFLQHIIPYCRGKFVCMIGLFTVCLLGIFGNAHAQVPVTSGLSLWLDASDASTMTLTGSTVEEWRDKNGSGAKVNRQAGNPTRVTSGIGGLPTVNFVAASNSNLRNAVNYSTPVTIFYVSRQKGGINQRVLSGSNNNWLLGYWSGKRGSAFFGGDVLLSGNGNSDLSPHLYAATIPGSGQNSTVWAEGSQIVSNQGGTAGPDGLSLGGVSNTQSEPSDCDISEVLVYNRILNATELNQVGYYISAKYGLSTSYTNTCIPGPGNPDTDGDGVANTCDQDDDNDGILDTNEGTTVVPGGLCLTYDFNTTAQGWVQQNDNNNLNPTFALRHSSSSTTANGCSIPAGVPGGGNYILEDDLSSGSIYFESPDNLNTNLSTAVGGSLSYWWINGVRGGSGGQNSNMQNIVLTGGGISVSTSINITNEINTGWKNKTIPLTDAVWSGSAADLLTVLSDLDRIEIQVEDILSNIWDGDCNTVEYFGLDELRITCASSSVATDTDGDGIPNALDTDSDNDGCPDAIEGGANFTAANINGSGSLTGGVNATTGIPTVAGAGQTVSGSQVATQLAVTTAPANQTVAPGAAASFSIATTASNNTSWSGPANARVPVYGTPGNANTQTQYQWWLGNPSSGGTQLTNAGVYSGVTTATLNISNSTGLFGNVYYVVVTHSSNSCISEVRSASLLSTCTPGAGNPDTDGDGLADVCDLDDDNDGISDIDEGLRAFCNGLNTININFSNLALQSGTENQVGSVYFASNVSPGINLRITLESVSSANVGVDVIDQSGIDWTHIISPLSPSSGYEYAQFLIEFLDASTGNPVNPSFAVASTDIDGNNVATQEVVAYSNPFYAVINAPTFINSVTFSAPYLTATGNTTGLNGNGFTSESSIAAFYQNTSSFRYRAGRTDNGTGTIPRQFRMLGNCATATSFTNPVLGIQPPSGYSLDSDGDGLPNHLDNDSDNDGCADAIEGGGSFTAANIDGNGRLTGGVNATTGIPTVAGAGQTIGGSQIATQLAVTTAPANQLVSSGAAASFSVATTASNNTSWSGPTNARVPVYGTPGNANAQTQYQWFLGNPSSGGTQLTNAGVYSGVTTATLNISNTVGLSGNVYYVVVTHSNNSCIREVRNATLTLVITAPDFNAGFVGQPIPGNVSTNDQPAGATYGNPAANPGNPSTASPTVNANGTYTFTTNVPGVYLFNVPVCPPGQSTGCPTERLTITVTNPAVATNPPVANTDIATTANNTPVTIPVRANDGPGNLGGTLATPTLVGANGGAANGTVTINGSGNAVYTPNPGFSGTDVFTYQVCETPGGLCATATVKVTVLPAGAVNTTSAADDYTSTTGVVPATGNVKTNDIDPEGNTTTVTPQTNVAVTGGTFSVTSTGAYTFTPTAGFTGTVNIPYTVCDNGTPQACASASLHVTVRGLPATAPDFNAGFVGQPIPGNVSTNDQPGSTYSNPAANPGNPSTASPTVNANGTYTFTTNIPGVYTFNVPVCPPGQSTGCPTERLTITVTNPAVATNPPVANTDIATTANNTPVTIPVRANDGPGNLGGTLGTPTLVGANGGAANGTVTINGSGNAVYTPNPGFSGTDVFTYQVCETPGGLCATATVKVTVLPAGAVNTTSAADDYVATTGTTPATGNVKTNDIDPEGNTTTVTPQTNVAVTGGTFSVTATGAYTFTPTAGFTGTANIPYTVCDNGTPQACASASLHVTVRAQPATAPDFNAGLIGQPIPGNVSTNDQPAGATYGNPAANPGNPSTASPTVNANGTYTFTTNIPGVYTFNVPVCPPGQSTGCPTERLTITVTNPAVTTNPPVANTDIATTANNAPVTIPVRANDGPGNVGGTLGTPTLVGANGGAANGTVTINGSGNAVYTPNPGFSGTDVFTYQVCETPSGLCATATVKVTVLPAGAVNTTSAADDYTSTTGVVPATGNVKTNDIDPEGNTTTVTPQTNVAVTGGTFSVTSTGAYTFTPTAGFTGTVNIPYTVCDNGTPQACASASLHIVVGVGALADLTPSQFFTSQLIEKDGSIDMLVVVRNIGIAPTTDSVEFSITRYTAGTGITTVLNTNNTFVFDGDTYTLNLNEFDVTVTPLRFNFKSKPGVVFNAGESKFFALTLTRGANNSNGNIFSTIGVVSGTGGGETPTSNNIITNTVSKN